MSPENKMRLLIIYAIVYPDKFEGDKGEKLMQVFHVKFFIAYMLYNGLVLDTKIYNHRGSKTLLTLIMSIGIQVELERLDI